MMESRAIAIFSSSSIILWMLCFQLGDSLRCVNCNSCTTAEVSSMSIKCNATALENKCFRAILESNELELRCATTSKCDNTQTDHYKKLHYKKVTCCETDNCNGARSSPRVLAGMHVSRVIIATSHSVLLSACFAIMFSQANILQGRFSLA